MSRTTKNVTAIACGIVLVWAGIVCFSAQSFERHAYLGWLSGRQQALSFVGARILAYAKANDGAIPPSLEALQRSGILSAEECAFRDRTRLVQVSRRFRPVPKVGAAAKPLVLIIETYTPCEYGDANVLFTDGSVVATSKIDKLIEDDNALRREAGLPEID